MRKQKLIASIIKTIVVCGLLVLYIVPFIFVVVNSFKDSKDVTANPLALPTSFSFHNYFEAFKTMNYSNAFMNTLIITVISVGIIIIFSSMTAYIMVSKKIGR